MVGQGLDKGWTRPPQRSSVAISFAGREGQRISHEKTFVSCEVLNPWKRLRAPTCKGHNLKKYLQGELESQNAVPGGP